MTTCIDLRERFGGKYRIEHDPAYVAEHGERGRADDPWLLVIPATFGHFYPWGGDRLAFSTNHRGPMARQLAKLPFVRIEQDAIDGYTITFPAERFNEVAQIAKPKRRRVLTPEQREALIAAGVKGRFPPGHGAKPCSGPQISTPAA